MRTRFLRVTILLMLLVHVDAVRADSDVVWDFSADHELVQSAQALIQQGKFPEGRRVIQLEHQRHVHVTDKNVVETVQSVYYYPATDSVQNSGTESISWNTHNQSLTVSAAAVVSSDGQIHRFVPDTAQYQDRDSSNVFTTTKEVVIQLPGLDEGSVSVLRFTRVLSDPDNYLFNNWAEVSVRSQRREFSVTWTNDNRKPNWYVDEGAFDCDVATQEFRCRSLLGGPWQNDDAVHYADVLPKFTIAAPNTWDDVVHDMRGLVDQATRDREALTPIVEELRDADDPLPQMLQLAANQIRYVSFSEAQHAYLPHPIGDTLKNRYGDCKDKSVLLLALLEEMGYQAYPTLVATRMQNPQAIQLPSRAHFDHMVVCAQFAHGERCFDATDTHSGSSVTPRSVQGKVRLDLTPGSIPSKIPKEPHIWHFDIENNLTFLADGGQTEALTRTYTTAYAAWMRRELGAQDASEQQDWLLRQHNGVVKGLMKPTFSVSGLDDLESTLSVESTGNYQGIATPGENLAYVDGAHWIRKELRQERINNKRYSAETSGVHYTSVYHFDLAGLWQLQDVGADVNLKSPYGSFVRDYDKVDGGLRVKSELQLPSQRLEPDQFSAYNRFLELIEAEIEIRFWGAPAKQLPWVEG